MISTALFIIILVLINAPAWTFALVGVYFAFLVIERVKQEKAKKALLKVIDEIVKAFKGYGIDSHHN
jgi:1,4-dihydroxy-2-naphthoate octaprenyltransferase